MKIKTNNYNNQAYLDDYDDYKMEWCMNKNGGDEAKARLSVNQYISKTRKLMDFIDYDVAELNMEDLMKWAKQTTSITANKGKGGTNEKSLNHIRGFLKDLIRINTLDAKDRMSKELLFYLATN